MKWGLEIKVALLADLEKFINFEFLKIRRTNVYVSSLEGKNFFSLILKFELRLKYLWSIFSSIWIFVIAVLGLRLNVIIH